MLRYANGQIAASGFVISRFGEAIILVAFVDFHPHGGVRGFGVPQAEEAAVILLVSRCKLQQVAQIFLFAIDSGEQLIQVNRIPGLTLFEVGAFCFTVPIHQGEL